MARRHATALSIVNPGASNPSGVALTIHECCKEVLAEGGGTSGIRNDPAIKLMTYQLAMLMGMEPVSAVGDDYAKWIAACEEAK